MSLNFILQSHLPLFNLLQYCVGKYVHYLPKQNIPFTEKNVRIATLSKPDAPLFFKLQLRNIFHINTFLSCTFVFRALYDADWPHYIKDYFVHNNQFHNYSTRQSANLHLLRHRASRYQRHIRYHGAKSWNNYLFIVDRTRTLSQYKHLLKEKLLGENLH